MPLAIKGKGHSDTYHYFLNKLIETNNYLFLFFFLFAPYQSHNRLNIFTKYLSDLAKGALSIS